MDFVWFAFSTQTMRMRETSWVCVFIFIYLFLCHYRSSGNVRCIPLPSEYWKEEKFDSFIACSFHFNQIRHWIPVFLVKTMPNLRNAQSIQNTYFSLEFVNCVESSGWYAVAVCWHLLWQIIVFVAIQWKWLLKMNMLGKGVTGWLPSHALIRFSIWRSICDWYAVHSLISEIN